VKSLVGGMFGKYEINRLLGEGGMGEVYEAYDTDKGRSVALKVLTDRYAQDETFRTRFLRESRVAATLQEPHVVPIHDWGEIDDNLYIDMRLVEGKTLHDLLKNGPLDPQRATDIVGQIATALDAAHAQGLIHRDVKPQNIIVTPNDFAYLVDFGIAATGGDTQLTAVGYHIGSFDYMAPERFDDDEATPATDVYSLACVLYQVLTGAKPFPAHSAGQAIKAHTLSAAPRPSEVDAGIPATFDEVIARGMAKDPDDRYVSAGALGRAAKRALSERCAQPVEDSGPTALNEPPPVISFESFNAQNDAPSAEPTVVSDAKSGSSRQLIVAGGIGVAVALVVGIVGVGIGLLADRNSGPQPSPTTVIAYPNSVPSTNPPPLSTATQQAQPTRVPPTTVTEYQTPPTVTQYLGPTAVPAPPVLPDSLQQLRQIASGDRSFVYAQLAGLWVPQLSAKRPGSVDSGVVWDNDMTLQEHLQLRQRYPGVRLLWSGGWSTFSGQDYWVTVAGITFADSAGALQWCRYQGFDRDHCIAKLISTTHPVDGSTAYN
jgi:serine/threonine protein kinase